MGLVSGNLVGSTNVLAAIGHTVVGQTEVDRQFLHDACGADRTVNGVSNDGGAKSNSSCLLLLPVGEVRLGLIVEEGLAVIGVKEAGHADDVDLIGLGHAFLNLLSGPAGAVDAGIEGTVIDFAINEEGFEIARRGGPHSTTGVPTNGTLGACFDGRSSEGCKGCAGQKTSCETVEHGRQKGTSPCTLR